MVINLNMSAAILLSIAVTLSAGLMWGLVAGWVLARIADVEL